MKRFLARFAAELAGRGLTKGESPVILHSLDIFLVRESGY